MHLSFLYRSLSLGFLLFSLTLIACNRPKSTQQLAQEQQAQQRQQDEDAILHLVSQKINGDQMDGISLDSTAEQIKRLFHIRQSTISSPTPTVDNGVLPGKRMTWTLRLQMAEPFGSKPEAHPQSICLQMGLTESIAPQAETIARKVAQQLNAPIGQPKQVNGRWLYVTHDLGNIYITIQKEEVEKQTSEREDNTFDFTAKGS